MKLHLNVTKATVEKALAELTVGERAMLYEGEFTVVSARLFLSRFLCHEDLTPIAPATAKRIINGLSPEEFDEAIAESAQKMTDAFIPPESASAS